jgi:hypothetical protein
VFATPDREAPEKLRLARSGVPPAPLRTGELL